MNSKRNAQEKTGTVQRAKENQDQPTKQKTQLKPNPMINTFREF